MVQSATMFMDRGSALQLGQRRIWQADSKAGRQAGKQESSCAGKHAGKQLFRQAGRQASSQTYHRRMCSGSSAEAPPA